jgi:hypothetical protein
MGPQHLRDYAQQHAVWLRPRVTPPELGPRAAWVSARALLGDRLLEARAIERAGALRPDTQDAEGLLREVRALLASVVLAEVAEPLVRALFPRTRDLSEQGADWVLRAFVAGAYELEGSRWTESFRAIVDMVLREARVVARRAGLDPIQAVIEVLRARNEPEPQLRFSAEQVGEQSFVGRFELPGGEVVEGQPGSSKARARREVAIVALRRLVGEPEVKPPEPVEIVEEPSADGIPALLGLQRITEFDGPVLIIPKAKAQLRQWYLGKAETRPWVTLQQLTRHTGGTWRVDGWRGSVERDKLALVRLQHGEQVWWAAEQANSMRKALDAAARVVARAGGVERWLGS